MMAIVVKGDAMNPADVEKVRRWISMGALALPMVLQPCAYDMPRPPHGPRCAGHGPD